MWEERDRGRREGAMECGVRERGREGEREKERKRKRERNRASERE